MMQQLAIWIVGILEKKGALRSDVSRETYIYGFDIAIYTFLSTFGLFLIGWIADRPLETALLIFLYYTNQSSGGGFHASSHLMCFLTMVFRRIAFPCFFPSSVFTLYLQRNFRYITSFHVDASACSPSKQKLSKKESAATH